MVISCCHLHCRVAAKLAHSAHKLRMQTAKLLLPLRRALSAILSPFFPAAFRAAQYLGQTAVTVATWSRLERLVAEKNATKTQKLVDKKKRQRLHRMSRLFRMPLPPSLAPSLARLCIPPWPAKNNNRKNFKSTPTRRLFFGDYERRTANRGLSAGKTVAG